jgi:hypothetical protein
MAAMKCAACGNEEHPATALFCVKCGAVLDPSKVRPPAPPTFPGLFEVRAWLEGEPERKGLFGPYRRRFGLSFVYLDKPKSVLAADGTLSIRIRGVFNKADVAREVRVRKEEFVDKRMNHLTLSVVLTCYIYHHPEPAIPVPTDGGCRMEIMFTPDGCEPVRYIRESTYFTECEPGTEEPNRGPWYTK